MFKESLAYGPVPSRRLGQSLGINNIPPKVCTYSCVYCQIGKTLNMQTNREAFYKPEKIANDVQRKIREAKKRGERIDYLAFVPDGEPTLDVNIGEEIQYLKDLGIKIAVITNASLLNRREVRDDLKKADWVSVKIDAISHEIWRKVNRPYGYSKLYEILDGISNFAKNFSGNLNTESMLIRNINDSPEEIEKIADFIHKLPPKKSYLAIPTRPPAQDWVEPTVEENLNKAYQIFKERNIPVEHLIGYEGNAFAFTGDVEEDLLSITAVHPMRSDGVEEYLRKVASNWKVVEKLVEKNKLKEVKYKDKTFYLRKIQTTSPSP